jgi:hypothetical protein
MVRHMADERDDVIIDYPNRDKAASKATKAVVILLLLLSAFLTAVILFGGWDAQQGMQFVTIAYIGLYVLMAFLVLRWRSGVLPVIAALAMIMGIFAAVAGPEWFQRDKEGFTSPAIDENVLGMLTLLMVPLQVLLIAFAMSGFRQAWHVEVERPARGRDGWDDRGGAAPVTA